MQGDGVNSRQMLDCSWLVMEITRNGDSLDSQAVSHGLAEHGPPQETAIQDMVKAPSCVTSSRGREGKSCQLSFQTAALQ